MFKGLRVETRTTRSLSFQSGSMPLIVLRIATGWQPRRPLQPGLTGTVRFRILEVTNMLYILLWIVHVVVCLFLIVVVLLQSGKAADLAGAFGGMGSQTAFGPRGSATLLSKATTVSAILFMVTSLSLSILATKNAGLGTSVLESAPKAGVPAKSAPVPAPAPAQPQGGVNLPLQVPPQTPQNTDKPGAPATPAPAGVGQKK